MPHGQNNQTTFFLRLLFFILALLKLCAAFKSWFTCFIATMKVHSKLLLLGFKLG